MCTPVVLFALSGYLAHVGIVPESPRMLRNYGSALEQVQSEKKPLAVFIGCGPTGWQNVAKDGELSSEVTKTLDRHYVCVYLDTTDQAGKELASSFRMLDGPGLIISDQEGQKQAFRVQGELESGDLQRYLVKYADPDRSVATTETPVTQDVRYYAPVQVAPAMFAPSAAAGCSH